MVVDFRAMSQTNVKTGKSRPVRESPSKTAPAKHAPKPSAPSAGPAKYPKLSKPSAGDIYVHTTPSAPPPVVPAAPTTPEKTDAKKPEAKRKGAGFFTGMAVGTVAAAGAGVGIGLATGAITTDDIGDAAAEVGDAM